MFKLELRPDDLQRSHSTRFSLPVLIKHKVWESTSLFLSRSINFFLKCVKYNCPFVVLLLSLLFTLEGKEARDGHGSQKEKSVPELYLNTPLKSCPRRNMLSSIDWGTLPATGLPLDSVPLITLWFLKPILNPPHCPRDYPALPKLAYKDICYE